MVIMAGAGLSLAADWPQWRGPARDGGWTEAGLVERFASPQLPIQWRVAIGSGYSGPTVAEGRVFVMDRVARPSSQERVLCFDAETGKEAWSYAYDCRYQGIQYEAGPRCSVTIDEGRAYALGTMGHLHCFEAQSGKLLWKHDCRQEYGAKVPIWGIAASPLVDGGLVIVHVGGKDGASLIAFDKVTGQEKWRALNDPASYSSPIVIEQAGRRVLVCLTGERMVGLDPQTGRLHWQYPFRPKEMVITIATPVFDGPHLVATSFYDGMLLLNVCQDVLAVERLWQRRGENERNTDALHCCISTPIILGDYLYGVDSHGELRCLDLKTGGRVWEDLTATPKARWSNIHMVRNGDKIWMFNERGELIIGTLDRVGFHEISRAKLIEPTTDQLDQRGGVCWSHPAFANRCVYARNDRELVCADLSAK
ncbi:MAG: PQQ-binding-like beta-propeller repeat protein [Phycisphaerales bacterium]